MSKPVYVGELKIGQYVIIDGEPCRIVEFEKSKPGKHGSAKARIVAISAFTGQKKTLLSPVDGRTEVPMIDKRTAQIISISGNLVQMMDMENYATFESPMPDGSIDNLISMIPSGDIVIIVTIWVAAMVIGLLGRRARHVSKRRIG